MRSLEEIKRTNEDPDSFFKLVFDVSSTQKEGALKMLEVCKRWLKTDSIEQEIWEEWHKKL